jgi:hypothetical protein
LVVIARLEAADVSELIAAKDNVNASSFFFLL